SPYASAFAAAAANGAESEKKAAKAAPAIASTADAALVEAAATTAHTKAHGATIRNSVSPHGRGVKSANNPAAQTAQRITAARRAGAVDQSRVASASAPPIVTGRSAQITRVHHSQITRNSASSCQPASAYPTNLHERTSARRTDLRRYGNGDREPAAPRRAHRGRAHVAMPAGTAGGTAAAVAFRARRRRRAMGGRGAGCRRARQRCDRDHHRVRSAGPARHHVRQ